MSFKSIDEYISTYPKEVQSKLIELRSSILEAVPNAVQTFNYGIPAFTLIENGKREEQIMMAGYKNHIGLYPHPTTIIYFKKELNHYKTAKGSIQFRLNQSLPKRLIIKMVQYRYQIISNSSIN